MTGEPATSPRERFESKYVPEPNTGCWLWLGSLNSRRGYGVLWFPQGAVPRGVAAHRFSYEMSKGPIPSGMLVRHMCNERSCVNPSHLEIGTHLDNSDDMYRADRACYGARRPNARLTDEVVREAKEARAQGVSLADLCRKYGVDHATLSTATRGKTWKHIEPGPAQARPVRRACASGERIGASRLKESQIAEIRAAFAAGGVSRRRLALAYGVSHTTIINVIAGRTWRAAS
jgi:lambda repressor-like predicted transcriptional regulator